MGAPCAWRTTERLFQPAGNPAAPRRFPLKRCGYQRGGTHVRQRLAVSCLDGGEHRFQLARCIERHFPQTSRLRHGSSRMAGYVAAATTDQIAARLLERDPLRSSP